MKTFSNSGHKITYLKALPYEFNQSHSKNAEKTQSRTCIMNPSAMDSQIPCPKNRRSLHIRPLSPQDPNSESQENPTPGHAATPSTSINAIMTLLKRG